MSACAAFSRATHRAPRTLASRRTLSSVSRPLASSSSLLARNSGFKALNSAVPRVSHFSTMSPLQQASPTTDKSYDPEIKDMAAYIHQYDVNSDLAVRYSCIPRDNWEGHRES